MISKKIHRHLLLGTFVSLLFAATFPLLGKDEPELFKVEGNITALPSSGFTGNWIIANKTVVVNVSTKVEQQAGPLVMGACAEAEGTLDPVGALLAVKLESTVSTECNNTGGGGAPGGNPPSTGGTTGAEDVKLLGAVIQLPAGGLLGTWRIGSRNVVVSQSTVIQQSIGPVRVDSCVEVEGTPSADGSIIAAKVEVRASIGGCSVPPSGGGVDDNGGNSGSGGPGSGGTGRDTSEFKHIGVIQEIPSTGLVGAWVVGGRTIGVSAQTRINQEDGMVRVGACLEAEGTLLSDASLVASKVSVELASKCGFVQTSGGTVIPSEFYGLVQAMPAGGREGNWQIGGRTVLAKASTEFEADEGEFVQGGCVEVEGLPGANGVISALKLDTEPIHDCAPNGTPTSQGFFELHGLIEQLPSTGLLGEWTVAGRTVRVFPGTVLDTEHGQAIVGACVEVKGNAGTNGFFDATKIEIRSVAGICLARRGVVSAASFSDAAVSPGKIVSLFGIGLGPETPATPSSDDLLQTRRFPKSLGGVRVYFDDSLAPLVFTSRGQINAVVPYSVKGKSEVEVQVEHQGIFSPVVKLSVAPAAPGIFTQNQSGKGAGAILNYQDGAYVVNTPDAAARRGAIVLIYITGEGEMATELEDGEIVSSSRLSKPKNEVKVFIGGRQAKVEYAGSAPDLIAGLAQLNVVVPDDCPTGSDVKVEVEIGGHRSQDNVTMSVRQ